MCRRTSPQAVVEVVEESVIMQCQKDLEPVCETLPLSVSPAPQQNQERPLPRHNPLLLDDTQPRRMLPLERLLERPLGLLLRPLQRRLRPADHHKNAHQLRLHLQWKMNEVRLFHLLIQEQKYGRLRHVCNPQYVLHPLLAPSPSHPSV